MERLFCLLMNINNKKYEFKSKLPNHFNEFLANNKISSIIDNNLSYFLNF